MVADFYSSRLNRDDPTGLFYALEQLYADGAFVCPVEDLAREVGGEAKNGVFRWNWRITSFSQTRDILKNECIIIAIFAGKCLIRRKVITILFFKKAQYFLVTWGGRLICFNLLFL